MEKLDEFRRDLSHYLVLPAIFLTVTLLGGLRVAADGRLLFLKPPLLSAALAVLLCLWFLRTGLVDLASWYEGRRSFPAGAAATLSLLSLAAATVQVLQQITPEKGIFPFLFFTFFLVVLGSQWGILMTARAACRSLAILLSWAFLVKYLLLHPLFQPGDSWTKALLQRLLSELSLGALSMESYASVTGYLALLTLLLYLSGLYLLAPREDFRLKILTALLRESPPGQELPLPGWTDLKSLGQGDSRERLPGQ